MIRGLESPNYIIEDEVQVVLVCKVGVCLRSDVQSNPDLFYVLKYVFRLRQKVEISESERDN